MVLAAIEQLAAELATMGQSTSCSTESAIVAFNCTDIAVVEGAMQTNVTQPPPAALQLHSKMIMPFVDHLALWSKDEFDESHKAIRRQYTRTTLPAQRSKLAACLNGQNLHIFGGRLKSGEIVRDLWLYNIGTQDWHRYDTSELPRLEGHAIASTETGDIYFFGGAFCRVGCPLWIWSSGSPVERVAVDRSVPAPGSRRGHSLTFINRCLFLYGGYIDLHGSTDTLWQFNCDSQQWSLLSIEDGPNGRHSHSAVAFNGCLFVYGGLSDLQAKGDFWKFDIAAGKWDILRTIANPGARFGHSCCVTQTQMFLFGGEDGNGNRKDDLWFYDFIKKDWSRVMCDPECRPGATIYSSLIALEPAHIAGNSRGFSIKKSPEYLVNSKLEAEAGECSVCKFPIVEQTPNTQEWLTVHNSGGAASGTNSSVHRRSPGSADSGFQEQYLRTDSEVGLLGNIVRRESTDTQPYMINMAFERGSTDVDEEHLHEHHDERLSSHVTMFSGRVSQVELFLKTPTEDLIDEELPGVVPEARPSSSNSTHSSNRSHHTSLSARSSARSQLSTNGSGGPIRSSVSDHLMPPPTPMPRTPSPRRSSSRRTRLMSTPTQNESSPFHHEPWFHEMPASVLNNNSLTRSLNVLPDAKAVEEVEMAQMTHFMRNGFVSIPANVNATTINLSTNADEELGREGKANISHKVDNFCAHVDGRCIQLMLIGGKYSAQIIGRKFTPDSLSVWRCCVRKL